MSDADIFYICGGVLAVVAVITSFIGLKSEKFPGKFGPVVTLVFIALIGVTATYAVLNGQHEEEVRAAETEEAGEVIEEEEAQSGVGEAPGGAEAPAGGAAQAGEGKAPAAEKPAAAGGPGGTLKLAASPTDLAYDTKELSSKPGKVTIDFTNPAALEHDVAIEKDGEEIAGSALIAESKTSVSADLAPGDLHLPLHGSRACRSRHGRHTHRQVASAAPPSVPCGRCRSTTSRHLGVR